MDEIFLGFISKVEIRSVICSMGVGKVFGVEGIIVELFKVDMIIIVEVLYDFFCVIWVCIGKRVLLLGYLRKGILLSVEIRGG